MDALHYGGASALRVEIPLRLAFLNQAHWHLVAEKRVWIGAGRQRRYSTAAQGRLQGPVELSEAAAWQSAAQEITGGTLQLANSRVDGKVCNECAPASPMLAVLSNGKAAALKGAII